MSAGNSYRLALVQQWESELPEDKKALWATVAARLPAPSDFGLELFHLGKIRAGATLEELQIFIPRRVEQRRRVADRRMAAAGENVELGS